MSSTRDNTYTNTNKRTFYLSDYVDNESIGKLMWDILYQIREDDERAKILKQIEILDKKCRTEKQPRRKLEIFEQIKKLKSKI